MNTKLLFGLIFLLNTNIDVVAGFQAGDIYLNGNFNTRGGGISMSPTNRTVFAAGTKVRGDLADSKLQKTKLLNLDMQDLDFQMTDLTEADLSGTNLKNAKLSNAKVKGAHFEKSYGLTDKQKADLKKRGAFVSDKDPKDTL